jgi:hypothetical protein
MECISHSCAGQVLSIALSWLFTAAGAGDFRQPLLGTVDFVLGQWHLMSMLVFTGLVDRCTWLDSRIFPKESWLPPRMDVGLHSLQT